MSLGLEIVLTSKDLAMSKDDLLFKNVMKIFAVVGALGIGLPLLYFVVPGLVTSLLMLGAIAGFFYLFIKFITIIRNNAAGSSCNSDRSRQQVFDHLSASARYGGPDYVSESNSWCPED